MKKKKLQKRNRKKYQILNNCDWLKAWRFFHILNTDDYRYLLDFEGSIPPEYDGSLLAPEWDKIVEQVDQIKGQNLMKDSILDLNEQLQDYIRLTKLKNCYILMRCGRESAIDHLKEMKVNISEISVESMRFLRSKILRLETKLNIEKVEQLTGEKNEDNEFIRSVIGISTILGLTIDKNNISTTEYFILEKEAKEYIKAKKHNLSGSSYKNIGSH